MKKILILFLLLISSVSYGGTKQKKKAKTWRPLALNPCTDFK